MDDTSELRCQYIGGQVVVMTGGTMRHNRIALNLARLLADRLEGTPFQVSGLRADLIVSHDEQRIEVRERDATGTQRALAYTAGEALASGWLGGEANAR